MYLIQNRYITIDVREKGDKNLKNSVTIKLIFTYFTYLRFFESSIFFKSSKDCRLSVKSARSQKKKKKPRRRIYVIMSVAAVVASSL